MKYLNKTLLIDSLKANVNRKKFCKLGNQTKLKSLQKFPSTQVIAPLVPHVTVSPYYFCAICCSHI